MAGLALGAQVIGTLIRLLLALLGRAAVAEAELSSPQMALIRDAARAVAVPAWAETTPRGVVGGTFGARYVWAPLRTLGAEAATPRMDAGETAPSATGYGPVQGWPRAGKIPAVGARERVRRRGPPPRAGPLCQKDCPTSGPGSGRAWHIAC